MRIPLLGLLALVLCSSCAPEAIRIRPTDIVVGRSEAAQTCKRQCDEITATSIVPCRTDANLFTASRARALVQECLDEAATNRDKCLRSCPL